MRLSRGVIIAWNQRGVYYLRAGRHQWTPLLRKQLGFDDVYDAAVSASGDIYVVALTKSYNDDHIYLWTTAAKPAVLPSDAREAAQTLLSRLASARRNQQALARRC